MTEIQDLVCPIDGCPDRYHRIRVIQPEDEFEGTIPIIGCGNPFHYIGMFKEWKWLESTFKLQVETYGYDYEAFVDQTRVGSPSPDLLRHLQWNTFAAYQELAELAYEFSWKPWATDEPFVHRERIIGEVVDVNHFLGNILAAVGCTDQEYEETYRKKQQKNRDRAASGNYSARKGGVGEGSDL